MKKTYQAKNIMCQSCSNTIKVSLEDDFKELEIDLSKDPKEVSLIIENEAQETKFKEEMKELGFEVIQEVK